MGKPSDVSDVTLW